MVIVVMSEDKPIRQQVAQFVAENLGWEYTPIESFESPTLKTESPRDRECGNRPIRLAAVIDSAVYEWRDAVISCPALAKADCARLRHNNPVVYFVHLRPAPDTNSSDSPVLNNTETTDEPVAVDCSQEIEEICSVVISKAVYRRHHTALRSA